jgi:hypothetical protein
MGLDMHAYATANEKQYREYWDSCELDPDSKEFVSPTVSKPKELAYWRKHPNLHGWFHDEWINQGNTGNFNGDQLEIDWAMLERLESAVVNNKLPATSGFFFGTGADEYYREQDLEFIKQARAELFLGLRVFYNSSW